MTKKTKKKEQRAAKKEKTKQRAAKKTKQRAVKKKTTKQRAAKKKTNPRVVEQEDSAADVLASGHPMNRGGVFERPRALARTVDDRVALERLLQWAADRNVRVLLSRASQPTPTVYCEVRRSPAAFGAGPNQELPGGDPFAHDTLAGPDEPAIAVLLRALETLRSRETGDGGDDGDCERDERQPQTGFLAALFEEASHGLKSTRFPGLIEDGVLWFSLPILLDDACKNVVCGRRVSLLDAYSRLDHEHATLTDTHGEALLRTLSLPHYGLVQCAGVLLAQTAPIVREVAARHLPADSRAATL